MSFTPTTTDDVDVLIGVVATCTMSGTTIQVEDGRIIFTADDIGKPIWIIGSADPIDADTTDQGMLRTTIASVTDASHAEAADAATQTTETVANTTLFRKRGAVKQESLTVNPSLTTHDTASFTFWDDLPKPRARQPVLIYIAGVAEFGGLIHTVTGITSPGSITVVEWKVDCVGWEIVCYKRTTGEPTNPDSTVAQPHNGIFDNTAVEDILKFLVLHALGAEGLDINLLASGIVIPSFEVHYTPCGGAFDQLITDGTQGSPPQWLHWYVTPDKVVTLGDDTTTPAPFGIGETDIKYIDKVELAEDLSDYINRVILRLGNEVSAPITTTLPGNGTRSYSVPDPIATAPVITVNGSPQTVGVQGVNTGRDWYYTLNSTAITQDDAGTLLTGTDSIVIVASRFQNGFADALNSTSVDESSALESGTGYHEYVQQQDNPLTLTDAVTYAQAITDQFGVVPRKIKIGTFQQGLRIGQHFTVNRSQLEVASETFVIDSVTITVVDGYVRWEVTAIGSPLVDWDYRATLARLRPGDGGGGVGGGGVAGNQMFWRTIDIKDTTVGADIGPRLNVQGTGVGIKISGVLRKAITANLVVVINSGTTLIGTLTIPSSTAVGGKVELAIRTKKLVEGQVLTFDITGSDGSKDKNGVAAVTLEWGVVDQMTISSTFMGDYDAMASYDLGQTVFDPVAGTSYLSLQDGNTGNPITDTANWSPIATGGASATVAVGTVTTGAAGSSVVITDSGTSSAAILDFTIPRGDTGAAGAAGATGATGATGSTGATGATGATGSAGAAGATGPGYLATSTTPLTIGTGSKSFTTQSGLAYSVGARVRATSTGSAAYMEGLVTSYSSTTLIVSMDRTSGSGTHTDWDINLAGDVGDAGSAGAAGATGATGPAVLHGFGADFDGGGFNLTAGLTAYVTVPVGGTISAWNLIVDAGTCTIKVWKVARGVAKPTSANSISISGLSISSGTAIHSATLTDFTTLAVADGDLIGIHLQTCTGVKQISFGIEL